MYFADDFANQLAIHYIRRVSKTATFRKVELLLKHFHYNPVFLSTIVNLDLGIET